MTDFVFANPNNFNIEDDAVLKDGAYVGQYSGQTLEQLQARDPAIELIDTDVFVESHDRRLTTDPAEIDEGRFMYLLECLPPCSWHHAPEAESFYMSEFTSGSVTNHVVRIGERYFTFDAPAMRRHADRVAKVQNWLNNQQGTQA